MCLLGLGANAQQRPWVEHIRYDARKDGKFELGADSTIFQYHNDGLGVLYQGEQPALHQALRQQLAGKMLDKQFDGLVRIRFVVNKQGQSGMFRSLVCNSEGIETSIDPASLQTLLLAVKAADGWQAKSIHGEPVHYYQYVLFRLQGGEVTQIFP
jgi:hypothetical protein